MAVGAVIALLVVGTVFTGLTLFTALAVEFAVLCLALVALVKKSMQPKTVLLVSGTISVLASGVALVFDGALGLVAAVGAVGVLAILRTTANLFDDAPALPKVVADALSSSVQMLPEPIAGLRCGVRDDGAVLAFAVLEKGRGESGDAGEWRSLASFRGKLEQARAGVKRQGGTITGLAIVPGGSSLQNRGNGLFTIGLTQVRSGVRKISAPSSAAALSGDEGSREVNRTMAQRARTTGVSTKKVQHKGRVTKVVDTES